MMLTRTGTFFVDCVSCRCVLMVVARRYKLKMVAQPQKEWHKDQVRRPNLNLANTANTDLTSNLNIYL